MPVLRIGQLVACALSLGLSGCGLFYDNSYEGTRFNIYSDRNAEFVESVGHKVELMYDGYEVLFDLTPEALGKTTIVLDGQDEEPEEDVVPEVLGYYVPLLNYICVDTGTRWNRSEEMLQQVLLHEVAHHFIVTEYSAASHKCWLNEGLAGNLEVTLFDEDHFEYPLINPALFALAQRAAFDPTRKDPLGDLVAMSWSGFHKSAAKEENYALSWSLVYWLLQHHLPADLSLGERFELIYRMKPEELEPLQPQWLRFLRGFDLTRKLLTMASNPAPEQRLTARWAVRQLTRTAPSDSLRVLTGLVRLFESRDHEIRLLSYFAFLETLERNPHSLFLRHDAVRKGLRHIGRVLEDSGQPLALRSSLRAAILTPDGSAQLESGVANATSAAAVVRALVGWSAKPTPSVRQSADEPDPTPAQPGK